MPKLFGFKIEDGGDDRLSKSVVSPIPENQEDSSDFYVSSGFYGQYVDIEGVYRSEFDLIKRYREMSLHPEVDSAIEDIINEAIVSDQNDSPVQIDLSNLPASDNLKKLIRDEFKYIKEMLDFDKKCHEIMKNWYVDGRIYYHKVIDLDKPEEGIKEVRYIDPLKIKFIRRIKKNPKQLLNPNFTVGASIKGQKGNQAFVTPEVEEFFQYDPNATTGGYGQPALFKNNVNAVTIAKDAVVFVHSGLVDRNKQTILSYLHKAIKSLNQLRMIEDSLVIYRLSRAPERRIFYIDVGNLPKIKAEQYLREVMTRYRNKLVYDAQTGEIRDDRKMMAMLEDFWLPRREGGRGTEITTLPGGQNLGELSDIEYFQKKLYRSLNVPESRLNHGGGFNLGRSSEILRDEIKFTKFVGRLRKRFSGLFNDLLKTQLILKNIVTPEDWKVLQDHIQYDYVYDNHFAELKETELMNDKIACVTQLEPYIGKYFSVDFVRRRILKQTDADIVEIDQQIAAERESGIIPPPMDPTTGLPVGQEPAPDQSAMGEVPTSPEASTGAVEMPPTEEAPKATMPKGGRI
jgi:Bacteriophage T4-like portal protein (Gp20)